jgi:hypothetical protein
MMYHMVTASAVVVTLVLPLASLWLVQVRPRPACCTCSFDWTCSAQARIAPVHARALVMHTRVGVNRKRAAPCSYART